MELFSLRYYELYIFSKILIFCHPFTINTSLLHEPTCMRALKLIQCKKRLVRGSKEGRLYFIESVVSVFQGKR